MDQGTNSQFEELVPFYINGRIEPELRTVFEAKLETSPTLYAEVTAELSLYSLFVREMDLLMGPPALEQANPIFADNERQNIDALDSEQNQIDALSAALERLKLPLPRQ